LNGLTGKQKAFIEEYFIDFNATRAAERAGYQGSYNTIAVTAHELLKNPKIKTKIAAHFQSRCMTADEVLMRLADQARADLGPYLFIKNGDLSVALDDLRSAGKTHLIKSVVPTKYGTKILLHDAQRALELIGKHHGLFVDRHEHTGKDGGKIQVETSFDGEQHARAIGTLNETLRAFGNRIDPQSTESMDSPEYPPVASDT
jgi:phage terminase small subunit